MDSELLVILVVTTPIWVLVGVAYLGRYLLKRNFKPNEEYLKEIKEIDKIRIFPFVNSIIAFTVIIIQPFNKKLLYC